MKILFVAFPFSIHTVRWIAQLKDAQWELHLYSAHRYAGEHPAMPKEIIYHSNPLNMDRKENFFYKVYNKIKNGFGKHSPVKSPEAELAMLIQQLNPDIIHSLESQHAGYLVSRVKQEFFSNNFPQWMHSNWGIDLHFFGDKKEHEEPLQYLLNNIDVFITEGKRDEQLARKMGFNKKVFYFPAVGGGLIIPERPPDKTSGRKIILVKGTQDIVRRGLIALKALEYCSDVLNNFEIILYSSCEATREAAIQLQVQAGLKITVQKEISHEKMLELNRRARISICTNLSDGLPNAMIEAMLMGAFPIQSHTSLADEWVKDGVTAFLVPPEDSELIALKIREALTNDSLVDNAAIINYNKIAADLNYDDVQKKAIAMYEHVYAQSKEVNLYEGNYMLHNI